MILYGSALTISPAIRARSWDVGLKWDHWLGVLIWLIVFYLAHIQTSRWLPDADPLLLPVSALLCGLGMLTVWRLLPVFGMRQSVWIAFSVGVLIAMLRLPPDLGFLRRYKYLWLTGSLLLTGLTLLLGTNPLGYGPRMWLGCCGVYLQPSEPLKLLLIAYLAAYMADRGPRLVLPRLVSEDAEALDLADRSPSQSEYPLLPLLAPTLIMTGLALAILVVQRDLGTAMVFLFLYAVIVYVTSGRRRVLLAAGLAAILAGLVGYWLFDVVRLRVDAWLNPWLDPSGGSFQIVQSIMAVANGGLMGRGPGVGNPGLVPVAHSDLIYAAVSEELGLIGAAGLVLCLALLASRGVRAALYAADRYRRYLAGGVTAYLVGQGLLIIAGNLRLAPLTGITLPFLSYGGSSLLVSFICIALLLHISDSGSETAAARVSIPYIQLGAFLLIGLAAAALATGWWAVYRAPAILSRTDNPRRTIADRSVQRGALLDRENDPINISTGEPGELVRQNLYPPLSSIVGYTHPAYGQSGLEASLDDYLRGLRANPGLSIWWNRLLYGQPPPGLDVRLSLDLELQRLADESLAGRKGALVALDAENGEVLAMASHPTFDANLLGELWDDLVEDPGSPLLNRAALGRYPTASLLEGFMSEEWARTELAAVPRLRLPIPEGGELDSGASPLQVALIGAVISSGGVRPPPQLATAVNTPQAGWVILPALDEARQVISPQEAAILANIYAVDDLDIWQLVAVENSQQGETITWYVGGTTSGWDGRPLAIALVLETGNPRLAERLGQEVLMGSITP